MLGAMASSLRSRAASKASRLWYASRSGSSASVDPHQTMTLRAELLASMNFMMSALIASTRRRWVSSARVLSPCTWET